MNKVIVEYSLTAKDYRGLIKERLPFEMKRLKAGKFITLMFSNPITRYFIFLYGFTKKSKAFSEDTVIEVSICEEAIITKVLNNKIVNNWVDALYVLDLTDFLTLEFESNTVVLPKNKLSNTAQNLIVNFAKINNKEIKN